MLNDDENRPFCCIEDGNGNAHADIGVLDRMVGNVGAVSGRMT